MLIQTFYIRNLLRLLSTVKHFAKPVFVFCFEVSDFWRNSAILMGNALYKSRLHEFLAPSVGSNPSWVLCYRSSTYGWAVSVFHSRCDGKRNTVTIIKNGQYVFGGYTDIPWGK